MQETPMQFQYPVSIEARVPARFDRVQLLVRVLVVAAISMLHKSGPNLSSLLYFGVPVVAAVLITHRGGFGFLERDATWLISAIEWVVGFYAFMLFVTDAFPLGARDRAVRLRVTTGGAPTVGLALSRLLTSLPHLIVLAILGLVSFVVAAVAAVAVLLFERYPEPLRMYQQNVTVWIARVLSYHASLVDTYPPFGFSEPSSQQQDSLA